MTKAEREERRAWLAGLKVGDEVCVSKLVDGMARIDTVKYRSDDWIAVRSCTGDFNAETGRVPGLFVLRPVTAADRMRADAKAKAERIHRATGWTSRDLISAECILAMAALLDADEAERKEAAR